MTASKKDVAGRQAVGIASNYTTKKEGKKLILLSLGSAVTSILLSSRLPRCGADYGCSLREELTEIVFTNAIEAFGSTAAEDLVVAMSAEERGGKVLRNLKADVDGANGYTVCSTE
eukprot:CAMPEP_0171305452 /NCGR_PEP_ID=MMETSP0816-20121228/15294_1 /TAXON_ID=420281 /ORGANISM="Proboscia inermis, Strain CCAP1064/1" /LENGTH=115 /DNA_ID=CAMNT_0011786289 /DNA_START=382 /DNA_END=730 /DNA_ORIENTATION=+